MLEQQAKLSMEFKGQVESQQQLQQIEQPHQQQTKQPEPIQSVSFNKKYFGI